MRHELLHVLGLAHSNHRNDLMYHVVPPSIFHAEEPTNEEIQALKNIYNLE
jgi:predicted Zn-dependent protease